MTNLNVDYIAGFFDGEGSIHYAISRSKDAASGWRIQLYVSFSQKTSEILYQIKEFLGYGIVQPDRRGGFRLVLSGKLQCSRFIALMVSRTHLKREQLLLGKQALQLYPGPGRIFHKDNFLQLLQIIAQARKLINRPKSNHHNVQDIIKEVEQRPIDWEDARKDKLRKAATKQQRISSGR